LNNKKYKNKIRCGLRWLPFDILHVTTNQKHVGLTEGGWDRTCYQAGTLGEHDSIVLGLLSMPKYDPSKYTEEGSIANVNNKYAVADNVNNKPLACKWPFCSVLFCNLWAAFFY
jgi:hypothetical protein